ncbi:hypothetical protein ALC57_06299 [Trachymyrmex cornetzi]|uniref:Uncharacterized protein n=1 Tax=Trachymyrmex cornetzi TaxID=471704 RepID=A0A195E843_9HYME|nr:hypothetical protein ALC57_06299 [Trachymyrmex cornetzi]
MNESLFKVATARPDKQKLITNFPAASFSTASTARHPVCESERQGTVQTELFEIMTGQDITGSLLNVKPFHFKVLEPRSENILR